MDANLYTIVTLDVCMLLLFAAVWLYTKRRSWSRKSALRSLHILVGIGGVGVVGSVYYAYAKGHGPLNQVYLAWLLLELGALFLSSEMKKEDTPDRPSSDETPA